MDPTGGWHGNSGGVIGELREGGSRDPIRLERFLALLREEVPSLARQGAQDAMECLEVLAGPAGPRCATVAVGRRSIACPDPPWGCGCSRSRLDRVPVLRLQWQQEPEDGSPNQLSQVLTEVDGT